MTYHIDVHLRNTQTGYSRVYQPKYTYSDDDPFSDFIWAEGNYSCDCNRSIFLYNWDEGKELECNTQNPIIIIDKIIRRDTGEVLYTEIEDPNGKH